LGDTVEAAGHRLCTVPLAAVDQWEVVIGKAVAVVVLSVADFFACPLEGIAGLGDTVDAAGHRMFTDALTAAERCEVVIGNAIAVVVFSIAGLGGGDLKGVIQWGAVRVVRFAITIIVLVHTVGHLVVIGVGKLIDDRVVAIGVDLVAQLGRLTMDARIEGGAVNVVQVCVVIVVVVAEITLLVVVVVLLSVVGRQWAVVEHVGDPVPIVVRVDAVR
jgi:hypothetical protein